MESYIVTFSLQIAIYFSSSIHPSIHPSSVTPPFPFLPLSSPCLPPYISQINLPSLDPSSPEFLGKANKVRPSSVRASVRAYTSSFVRASHCPSVCSIVYLFVPSSFVRFYSLVRSFVRSFVLSFVQFFCSIIHSFIHSFVRSFVRLFVRSFVRSLKGR